MMQRNMVIAAQRRAAEQAAAQAAYQRALAIQRDQQRQRQREEENRIRRRQDAERLERQKMQRELELRRNREQQEKLRREREEKAKETALLARRRDFEMRQKREMERKARQDVQQRARQQQQMSAQKSNASTQSKKRPLEVSSKPFQETPAGKLQILARDRAQGIQRNKQSILTNTTQNGVKTIVESVATKQRIVDMAKHRAELLARAKKSLQDKAQQRQQSLEATAVINKKRSCPSAEIANKRAKASPVELSVPTTTKPLTLRETLLAKAKAQMVAKSHAPPVLSSLHTHQQQQKQVQRWHSAPPPSHFFQPAEQSTASSSTLSVRPKVNYLTPPSRSKNSTVTAGGGKGGGGDDGGDGNDKDNKHKISHENGIKAEEYAQHFFCQKGFVTLKSKVGAGNGVDGIFIKQNCAGEISHVVIVESKYDKDGYVALKSTEHKGIQMTYQWVAETIKAMEKNSHPLVQEAAKIMKIRGNEVLDNRYINVMTPDGKVKWFRFVKKTFDTRTFDADPGNESDGDVYEIADEKVLDQQFAEEIGGCGPVMRDTARRLL